MTARAVVDLMLAGLAGAALAIGVMIFFLGPHGTASIFGGVLSSLGIAGAYSGWLDHPNTDSEMRFFAVFWFGFGLWIIDRLRAGSPSRKWIVIAAVLFWAGGFGRVLSFWQTGVWPDALFIGLMWIELIAPILLLVLFTRERSMPVGDMT